jgi:phenylacetic acid degradation operon negative regulatory protein
MQYLEAQKFVERDATSRDWVWRLTQLGRDRAQGPRYPKARWNRSWDGWWRQLIFDLPVAERRMRKNLLRWLRQHHFGYLQDSVWISPDPVDELTVGLKGFREDAAAFTLLECRCAPGFANGALVQGAWPFDRIHHGYDAYRQFAATNLKRLRNEQLPPRELIHLLRAERSLWTEPFTLDPLLPRSLWPTGYEGDKAWADRSELLGRLTAHLLR